MRDQVAPDEEAAQSQSNGRRLALLIGLPFIAAVALYWPSLQLPLIYDDLLHIRITGSLDFGSLWLPTEAFGFYRPLTFLPLVLIREIFGHYPAWLLHGLNVGQHAANVALLTWLSWRIWGRTSTSLAAGLLFAFFPFSYQAVAVYGHNVHPSTTGLLLAVIHSYLTALDSNSPKRLWALTTILFFFALLSHESAILFGPLAGAVQWGRAGARKPLGWPDPGRLLQTAAGSRGWPSACWGWPTLSVINLFP